MITSIIEDFQYPKEGIGSHVLRQSGGKRPIQEGTATITLEGETFEAQQGTSIVLKKVCHIHVWQIRVSKCY